MKTILFFSCLLVSVTLSAQVQKWAEYCSGVQLKDQTIILADTLRMEEQKGKLVFLLDSNTILKAKQVKYFKDDSGSYYKVKKKVPYKLRTISNGRLKNHWTFIKHRPYYEKVDTSGLDSAMIAQMNLDTAKSGKLVKTIIDSSKYTIYQKENGPFFAINVKNVKTYLYDDPESLEYINSIKKAGKWYVMSWVVMGGIVAVVPTLMLATVIPEAAIILGATGTQTPVWIIGRKRSKNMWNAVYVYR